MNGTLRILILEDSPDDLDLVERELKRGGIEFTSTVVKRKEEYERALKEFRPDVILSDHSLPSFNSEEALNIFLQTGMPITPIVGGIITCEIFLISSIARRIYFLLLSIKSIRFASSETANEFYYGMEWIQ